MSQETDPELTIPTRRTLADRPPGPRSGEPSLVQIYPVEAAIGTRYVLGAAPLVVGREGNCDIRVADRTVSRQHARIEPDAEGHSIVDLQSTNGTFVNEVRVCNHQLRDGDNLTVGRAVFRFLAGGNVEAAYHEEIHRLAILDPQTNIHNQRYLLQTLERELHRAVRYRRPLALLLFDADTFKTINDQFGHLAGDAALRQLVERVKEVLRREAVFARYGGDEFAVVLPETNTEDAVRVAERIRAQVGDQPFTYEERSYVLTVSVGVATTGGDELMIAQELIRLADKGLYQAKRQGRNRVVTEEGIAPNALS